MSEECNEGLILSIKKEIEYFKEHDDKIQKCRKLKEETILAKWKDIDEIIEVQKDLMRDCAERIVNRLIRLKESSCDLNELKL